MSLTVVFRQTALRNLARMRSEDKDLFARTRRTVALLADEPYPAGAVAWGATGIYRLHAGDIRSCTKSILGGNGIHHQHRGHLLISCPSGLTADSARRDLPRNRRVTLLADVAAAVLGHGRVPRDTPPRMLKTMRSLAAVVDLYLPSRAEFLTVWEAETSDAAASQALHAGERDDRVVAVTARPVAVDTAAVRRGHAPNPRPRGG